MTPGRRARGERGSTTLEVVIVLPATLLLLGLIIMAGRLALAQQAIQAVAYDTARAASISRTAAEARTDAATMTAYSFAANSLTCSSHSLQLDTSGFAAQVGDTAAVSSTVTCRVPLGDLSLPGVPGSVQLDATASSPLDPYREK